MSTNIHTSVTPALHPDNVKQIDGYESEDIAAVLGPTLTAFSEAYDGIASVHAAREKAKTNPTWNEAQQILATQDMSDKVFARIAKAMDGTRANLVKGIEHLEQELSAPVQSHASHPVAAEIRAHVKGLSTGQRMTFIRQAIESGDTLTSEAVLGAPAYLSGIEANMQSTLLRMHREKHSPHLAARLTAMVAARDLIQTRAGLVFTELEKAVGMPPHKVRQLREAKTAAEKAFVLKDVA